MSAYTGKPLNLIGAVTSMTVCSMGMMIFNKLAVRAFPLACSLVVIQMIFTCSIMLIFCWKSLHVGSVRDIIRWSPVVPFFVAMLLTSMFALKDAPMSMVITLRALSPWFALVVERFFPKPPQLGGRSVAALLLMLLGVGLYVKDIDSRKSPTQHWAVGWVLLNCLFATVERLLQRLMLAEDQAPVDISKTGVSLINNGLGCLPLVLCALAFHEHTKLSSVFGSLDRWGALWVFLSCLAGVFISYCAIWTQSLISATSMLVLINANKFIVILLEIFVMPEKTQITALQVFGATLTIVATVLYAIAREREETPKRRPSEEKAASETTRLQKKHDP